jgi:hypothetical protein
MQIPRKWGAALIAVSALLPIAAPSAASADSSRDVKVMTRNLYLGADLIPLASAPNRDAFEQAAAQRFQTVLKNDFATRAKGLADEIAKQKPDLIGVQEAAVWKRGPDGVKDGNTTPANQTVYDSTQLLLSELKKRGEKYRVAVIRPWFDFEAPTALGYDVRLTQNDVVLVRATKGEKVKVTRAFKGGYSKTFIVPTQVGEVDSPRGWAGVDAKLGKRKFRFVTTHLEAYSGDIANTQMQELLAKQLKSKKAQTILVGDFNSDPKDAGNGTPNAFSTAIGAGFSNPLKRRETCCFSEDLTQTTDKLDSWIDHVVVRPKIKSVKSGIVGNRTSDRVGGLWPSDHAGIWTTLRLK